LKSIGSKAIWLAGGDDNKKFFHMCANNRRNVNTIWEINNFNGYRAKYFKKIVEVGKQHFKNIFKDHEHVNIGEIMKILRLFHMLVDDNINRELEVELTNKELKVAPSSFRKAKSHGSD